jgi:hypothetical protein
LNNNKRKRSPDPDSLEDRIATLAKYCHKIDMLLHVGENLECKILALDFCNHVPEVEEN